GRGSAVMGHEECFPILQRDAAPGVGDVYLDGRRPRSFGKLRPQRDRTVLGVFHPIVEQHAQGTVDGKRFENFSAVESWIDTLLEREPLLPDLELEQIG